MGKENKAKALAWCFLLLAAGPAFAEELPVSTAAPAAIVVEPGGTGDFNRTESTETLKPQPAVISGRLMEKIRELEKAAAEEKGQDDAALERIGGKIGLKLSVIGFDEECVAAMADKSVDWRVRYWLIRVKGKMNPDFRIEKRLPALNRILLDRSEHPRLRGAVALMIADLAKENEAAKSALAEVAFDTGTPSELIEPVMSVLGAAGIDDVDRLVTIMNRPQQNLNAMGVSLNAIRALCKSKNPKAVDLLMKVFEESAPDSFYNATAIDELSCVIILYPDKRKKLEPVLVPKLLKLLDDRSYIGASRHRAAMLLVRMEIKEAYEPITRWFLPVKNIIAEDGGGGRWDGCYLWRAIFG